ncbi:MAG TPA: GMC oxidoreductase [Amaricoccus sp.]|nr:GMC oxidoreductase [Amaricoccus sp.]
MIASLFEACLVEAHSICIVGGGPVGLALGITLARLGLRVLLLESGGLGTDTFAASLAETDCVSERRHASSDDTIRRGLGGTSRAWGAGCTPYDPVDFEPRPEVGTAEVPLPLAELAPYYAPAAEFLGCGAPVFDLGEDAPGSPLRTGQITRFARQADMGRRHLAEIEALPNLVVSLNTTVTRLDLDTAGGRIQGVEVRSGGRAISFRTPGLVLACGGVEAARLLLCAQREHPLLLGGDRGPLGRYYMGHISGNVARIHFADPAAGRRFAFAQDADGSYFRRRLSFAPEVLRANRLLNVYFLPNNIPFDDPRIGSGALSALHLGLSAWYRSTQYLRHYRPGYRPTGLESGLDARRHLANILRSPGETVTGLAGILRARADADARPPGLYHTTPSGIFTLRYHAEQEPDPESRVTLSDRTDAHGVPLPRVDLRFGQRDVDSAFRAHGVLDELLRQSGLGRLSWHRDASGTVAAIAAQATDGYHQIGLTRMSHGPRQGVVDRDLAVHGFGNLWVSGTGVLPTGGQAHPTFAAVALAQRLAAQIAASRAGRTAAAAMASPISAAAS